MGTLANECLAPGQRGKVLAAFSNAIYLLTDEGELFWIVSKYAPMHRRALKISASLSGPQAGSPFNVTDHRLTIDPGFVFNKGNVSLWSAPQISREETVEITEIPARVQALFSNLDMSQGKGYGNFIPDLMHLLQNERTNPEPESADPILAFARPIVLDMANACLDHQPSRISHNTDALIGLGAGLTPSGDDFLGGLSFCLHTLQNIYPEFSFIDPFLLEPYRTRTHSISFTLLEDLAHGHAIAPLHQLVNDIFTGRSSEGIHRSIFQLTRVGHSTGWDMLTGFITGLLTTFPNPALQVKRSNLLEDQAMQAGLGIASSGGASSSQHLHLALVQV